MSATPLALVTAAFRAAVAAPGARVEALGDDDLGVPAQIEALLAQTPGGLEAARPPRPLAARLTPQRRCRTPTTQRRGWSCWRAGAWSGCAAWRVRRSRRRRAC